ncbi:unnamed protein product [Protopolystoma xenopodis]|uniref:Uncharacterized protein n=1 Tax=Protopolystoma xenopodis TaxID=117903 RepID=A0A3S5CMJ8_9PLAT|nr:unnamed protein product [Protopolystoma xenopodis]
MTSITKGSTKKTRLLDEGVGKYICCSTLAFWRHYLQHQNFLLKRPLLSQTRTGSEGPRPQLGQSRQAILDLSAQVGSGLLAGLPRTADSSPAWLMTGHASPAEGDQPATKDPATGAEKATARPPDSYDIIGRGSHLRMKELKTNCPKNEPYSCYLNHAKHSPSRQLEHSHAPYHSHNHYQQKQQLTPDQRHRREESQNFMHHTRSLPNSTEPPASPVSPRSPARPVITASLNGGSSSSSSSVVFVSASDVCDASHIDAAYSRQDQEDEEISTDDDHLTEEERLLLLETIYGALFSHLFWAVWCLIQSQVSCIEFGFLVRCPPLIFYDLFLFHGLI